MGQTLRPRAVVLVALLASLGLGSTANAGLMTYTDRATFEAQGPVTVNYGFEGLGGNGITNLATPLATPGVTYTSLANTIVSPLSPLAPLSKVLVNGSWGAITAEINTAPEYRMFGLDLGYLLLSSPMNLSVFTNLGTYSLTGLTLPHAGVGSNFYGFTVSGGEFFTGFQVIPAGTGVVTVDNVTLGAPAVPEPATVVLLGAGLLGLGATRRRRGQAAGAKANAHTRRDGLTDR